jgi:outer membrane biosynthesis protein TonB
MAITGFITVSPNGRMVKTARVSQGTGLTLVDGKALALLQSWQLNPEEDGK